MFNPLMPYIAVIQANCILKEIETEKFHRDSINNLPLEQRIIAMKAHTKYKEKKRKEDIEERRHKELCAAIRSTSFW